MMVEIFGLLLASFALSFLHFVWHLYFDVPPELRDLKCACLQTYHFVKNDPSVAIVSIISYAGTLYILWIVFCARQ